MIGDTALLARARTAMAEAGIDRPFFAMLDIATPGDRDLAPAALALLIEALGPVTALERRDRRWPDGSATMLIQAQHERGGVSQLVVHAGAGVVEAVLSFDLDGPGASLRIDGTGAAALHRPGSVEILPPHPAAPVPAEFIAQAERLLHHATAVPA